MSEVPLWSRISRLLVPDMDSAMRCAFRELACESKQRLSLSVSLALARCEALRSTTKARDLSESERESGKESERESE